MANEKQKQNVVWHLYIVIQFQQIMHQYTLRYTVFRFAILTIQW